jgi:hypothetical protein
MRTRIWWCFGDEWQVVQVCIGQKHPLTVCVHCSAHSLNLVITEAYSVALVRTCMAVVSCRLLKVLVLLLLQQAEERSYLQHYITLKRIEGELWEVI